MPRLTKPQSEDNLVPQTATKRQFPAPCNDVSQVPVRGKEDNRLQRTVTWIISILGVVCTHSLHRSSRTCCPPLIGISLIQHIPRRLGSPNQTARSDLRRPLNMSAAQNPVRRSPHSRRRRGRSFGPLARLPDEFAAGLQSTPRACLADRPPLCCRDTTHAPTNAETTPAGPVANSLPVTPVTPTMSQLAINSALLRGQDTINPNIRKRTRRSTSGVKREFYLPLDLLVRHITISCSLIMDIRAESMEVFVDPDMPWGDSYDGSPFKKGTGQRAVAERAATIFKKPELAGIGGFFYRIHSVRDRVSDYFVTNLCNRVRSFHLETSSFYKCNSYPKFPFVIEGEAWLGGL